MNAPSFEGAAGILRYDEVSPGGAIDAMRACLRQAIAAAGGIAAEGSADRSSARALSGASASEPAPHLPNIIHSTVLRWAAEPSEEEVQAARAEFERVGASWEPLEFTVDAGTVRGVIEDRPFMHVPHTAAQVFLASTGSGQVPMPRVRVRIRLQMRARKPRMRCVRCLPNQGEASCGRRRKQVRSLHSSPPQLIKGRADDDPPLSSRGGSMAVVGDARGVASV